MAPGRDRQAARHPLHVDIELAKQCNLKCIMCPFGDEKWSERASMGMMPTDMALKLVEEIRALGIPAIKPNFRGEPMLHKGLEDVLWAARGMTDIRLNTNLTGLTLPRAFALKQLCTLIIVSMDGATKETYERIRVGAKWDRFLANLHMLAAVPGKAQISVQMVVQRDNEHEVAQFQQDMAALGVEALTKPVMTRTEDGGALMLGSQKATGRRLCGHPYQRLVIGYDGTAYGCCASWDDEFPVGHYPTQSLLEIWNGDRMNELREMARNPDGGEPCRSCYVGTSYQWN